MDPQQAAILRKVKATPRAFIDSARHQNRQGLAALLDLSSVWSYLPATMELGIIDVFLSHLRADKAPQGTRTWDLDGDFAFLAIMSLGKMERVIDQAEYEPQILATLRAWPGIFRWCAYVFEVRVESGPVEDRRTFMDGLVVLLYVFSRFNRFATIMVDTADCVELVTKLWLLEEIPARTQSIVLGAAPTATLDMLLQVAAVLGKGDAYCVRVFVAAGEDADRVAKLLLRRVKKATQTLNAAVGQTALDLSWHIDLITELCSPHPHPLRRAFFDQGVVAVLTSSFVALSRIIVQHPTPDSIALFIACVVFYSQFLEGGDYPSVTQAIKTGFLVAFLDCSPAFRHLPTQSVDMARDIIRTVLPRYLVYRSIIEAVGAAIAKLPARYEALAAQPRVRDVWLPFTKLLAKRQKVLQGSFEAKRSGMDAVCDNMKCQKIDFKSEFRQCAACQSVYYCSPECQRLEWKASHKVRCRELKEERADHRERGRPKGDIAFCQTLAALDADDKRPLFYALARRDFPGTLRDKLLLCIDYTVVPEVYSLKLIEPGMADVAPVGAVPLGGNLHRQGNGRFQEYVSQMREDDALGGGTLVQSLLPCGTTVQVLTAPAARKDFWANEHKEGSGVQDGSAKHFARLQLD